MEEVDLSDSQCLTIVLADYSDVTEVIEGRTACQRLVNFLVDLKKAPGGEFPPTIISSAAFANSTVKQLQVKAGAEQLNIEGIILPSHQYEIHKVMHDLMQNRPIREYEVEYFTDKPTKALSNYVPGRSLEKYVFSSMIYLIFKLYR